LGVFVGFVVLGVIAGTGAQSAEAFIQFPVLFIIGSVGAAISLAGGVNVALYALLLPFNILRE
jgi:hypothetical protein